MAPLFLTLSIVLNAVANSFFKVAAAIPDLSLRKAALLGVGLFIGLGNTVCFVKALEQIDLGTSYAIFSAGSITVIALISLLFFREGMSVQKVAGLVTICIGLFLLWKS